MPKSRLSFTQDDILLRLHREGMRVTMPRMAILDVLFAADGPLSLDEIHQRACSPGISPDFATVFRVLVLLEKLNFVHRVNLRKPGAHYELHDPQKHYDHVICTECGKSIVIDIPCPLADTQKQVAKLYKFKKLTHSLEFFGICEDCHRSGNPGRPKKQGQLRK